MGDLDHRSLKTALSDDNSMVLAEDSITLWWWEGGGTAAGQNHLLLTDCCCASARVHNHVSFICCFGQNEIKMFASPQHEVKTSELSALLGKAFFRWWVFLATYYYSG